MRNSRRRAAAAAGLAGALVLAVAPMPASATPTTISGSMEGALAITPGDWIAAGYHFTMPGQHAAATVYFAYAEVTIPVACADGSTGTIVIPLNPGPWSDPANGSQSVPWQDQAAPSAYQGAVQAPNLCNGAAMFDQSGASFAADVQSNDTANPIQIQFHYRDPNAKGKGNADCADPNSPGAGNAAVCGASVSPTPAMTASPECLLTTTAINLQGQKYIAITVQDSSSGLQGIQVAGAVNADVTIPTFTSGTTSPVVVTATKIDQAQGASVALTAQGGHSATHCDPDW